MPYFITTLCKYFVEIQKKTVALWENLSRFSSQNMSGNYRYGKSSTAHIL